MSRNIAGIFVDTLPIDTIMNTDIIMLMPYESRDPMTGFKLASNELLSVANEYIKAAIAWN